MLIGFLIITGLLFWIYIIVQSLIEVFAVIVEMIKGYIFLKKMDSFNEDELKRLKRDLIFNVYPCEIKFINRKIKRKLDEIRL